MYGGYRATRLDFCLMHALTDTEAFIYSQRSSIGFSSTLCCVSVLSVAAFATMNSSKEQDHLFALHRSSREEV